MELSYKRNFFMHRQRCAGIFPMAVHARQRFQLDEKSRSHRHHVVDLSVAIHQHEQQFPHTITGAARSIPPAAFSKVRWPDHQKVGESHVIGFPPVEQDLLKISLRCSATRQLIHHEPISTVQGSLGCIHTAFIPYAQRPVPNACLPN